MQDFFHPPYLISTQNPGCDPAFKANLSRWSWQNQGERVRSLPPLTRDNHGSLRTGYNGVSTGYPTNNQHVRISREFAADPRPNKKSLQVQALLSFLVFTSLLGDSECHDENVTRCVPELEITPDKRSTIVMINMWVKQ